MVNKEQDCQFCYSPPSSEQTTDLTAWTIQFWLRVIFARSLTVKKWKSYIIFNSTMIQSVQYK